MMYLEPPLERWEVREPGEDVAAAERLEAFVRAARGAFSRNSERAMRSDLAIWAAWCAARGERPLPARPETVAAFVDAMAETRAPATVRRYVASIAVAHRAVGREKTLKSPPVRLALKRMHRARGRRQGQATGLTWPLRQRLLEAAGERVIDDRNRALLATAYDTMLRRGELTALQVSDLFEEMGGDATLLVRRSKADQEGEGETVWVAPDSVRLLKAWLARAGLPRGRCSARWPRAGRSAARCRRGRWRASSRAWRGPPGCRGRWWRACRGTAPGSARPRT